MNGMMLALFFEAAVFDLLTAGIICVAIGLLLCCIETLIPGIGAFGIIGGLSFLAGEIMFIIVGVPAWIIITTVVGGILLIMFMIWVIGKSIKKGKLSKSEMFDVGTSVPTGTTEGTKDYTCLIGKTGVTTTLLRPVGVAVIDSQTVDCLAKFGIIEENRQIKVVAVEGQRIVVEEIE